MNKNIPDIPALQQNINTLFTQSFPSNDSHIEIRDAQIDLATKIESTMQTGGIFLAEAGTGTGKSFSYLVPALRQAIQGKQIVIVTGTIALQHQLQDKDIPRIQKLLGTAVPVTVLKGKTNYLCKERLGNFLASESQKIFGNDNMSHEHQDALKQWSRNTTTGDKEELGRLIPPHKNLWSEISTHEYACRGKKCSAQNPTCFYIKARRQTKQASIIITNYHLLSYHLQSIQESADGEESAGLLPEDAIYILDEAHKLAHTTRNCLEKSLGIWDTKEIYSNLFGKKGELTIELERGSYDNITKKYIEALKQQFIKITQELEQINQKAHSAHEHMSQSGGTSWSGASSNGASSSNNNFVSSTKSVNYQKLHTQDMSLLDSFHALSIDFNNMFDLMDSIVNALNSEDEIASMLAQYKIWCSQMANIAQMFSLGNNTNNQLYLCKLFSPSNISYAISPLLVDKYLSTNFFDRVQSAICLSATLTFNKKFEHWIEKSGAINPIATKIYESPFPYHRNVLLAIPNDAPEASSSNMRPYYDYLYNVLPKMLAMSQGRALILCTSKDAVQKIATHLNSIKSKHSWNLLTQESNNTSNSKIAEQFREDTHSVLVATLSFWEGFDAPGDTLKMLIITKLPFPNPKDLFIEEESSLLRSSGGNPFYQILLPEAELRLKQGFGRLMRSAQDTGVVFIADSRLINKNYGLQLTQALPKCLERISNTKEILQEINAFFKN